jgi:hypothetical protein
VPGELIEIYEFFSMGCDLYDEEEKIDISILFAAL